MDGSRSIVGGREKGERERFCHVSITLLKCHEYMWKIRLMLLTCQGVSGLTNQWI